MSVPDAMTGLGINTTRVLVRAQFNALNPELNIPEGVSGNGGIVGKPGQYQYYGGTADQSLELAMHEFGHNMCVTPAARASPPAPPLCVLNLKL